MDFEYVTFYCDDLGDSSILLHTIAESKDICFVRTSEPKAVLKAMDPI